MTDPNDPNAMLDVITYGMKVKILDLMKSLFSTLQDPSCLDRLVHRPDLITPLAEAMERVERELRGPVN